MMNIEIGLAPKQREGVVGILAGILADEAILYQKTRNYHWNVAGPQFNDLHKFFGTQYDDLAESIDEVAERIRALGAPAPGSLADFLKLGRLKEQSGQLSDAHTMLTNLLADHESVIRQLRGDLTACMEKHGDAGTSDFLTGLMEDHEKMAWMLRSFLNR